MKQYNNTLLRLIIKLLSEITCQQKVADDSARSKRHSQRVSVNEAKLSSNSKDLMKEMDKFLGRPEFTDKPNLYQQQLDVKNKMKPNYD